MRKVLPCLAIASLALASVAQDRLPNMPRYDRYEKLRRQITGSVTGGSIRVEWTEDGKSFTFPKGDLTISYDLATNKTSEAKSTGTFDTGGTPKPRRARGNPERGRQFSSAISDDGKWKAECKDRNVFIGPADGDGSTQITTEGSVEKRIKCGVASWVYGEELGQREAMWWSPDAKKLAFYRFDESLVPDYYVPLNETGIQNKLETEAYPKAGAPNPVVELRVYDLASKATTAIDVHFKSDGDPDLGHYVYSPRWSEDGKSLLYFRMNRKQNCVELCAADPGTGANRVIFRESNPDGWVDYSPANLWTDPGDGIAWKGASTSDAQRFLWISDRDGYRNLYLYDLSGKLIKQVTSNKFDLAQVLKVDKQHGLIWYSSHDGDVPYKQQVHRVSLEGKDQRLTDPAFNHTVQLAPDGQHFADVVQSIDTPPKTILCDVNGKVKATLGESDTTKWDVLYLKKAQRFQFKAADGVTDLYGYYMVPADFNANKQYPLLINVYGGPESGTATDAFKTPDPVTELGFVVAWIDGRGTNWRGRAFRQCVYGKLGITEIDDQAAGAKYLGAMPFIDKSRIGIQGTSYGGYASLMALLRYPNVFKAACSSSPVTDWKNYDSTYTERYMDIPQDNPTGYEKGSAMTYAKDLKGNLLLYYGTADNNVHPSNSFQLVRSLQTAGKYFEMMVGPDQGHSQVNSTRMWEFFVEHLILDGEKPQLAKVWDGRKVSERVTTK